MSSKPIRIFLSLVLVVLLGGLAGSSAIASGPSGIHVQFNQLNWLGSDAKSTVPLSRAGEVQFSFDRAALAQLTGKQGRYLNLTISRDGVGTQWVVRNLYVHYPDAQRMLGSRPSVQFDLGIPNGARLSELRYELTLSQRFVTAPDKGVAAERAAVGIANYRVGGRHGLTRSLETVPSWVGFEPDGKLLVQAMATEADIKVPVTSLGKVDEGIKGCAPGAVARSIKYMLDNAGKPSPAVQDIYRDLYGKMKTNPVDGTDDADLVSGKKAYNDGKGFPITTTMNNTGFGNNNIPGLMTDLGNGNDIEILISWVNSAGAVTGGHVAIVTKIVVLPNGDIQITYADDPVQGDGTPDTKEQTITVKPNGTFPGGRVDGFVNEKLNPTTPTTPTSPGTGTTTTTGTF